MFECKARVWWRDNPTWPNGLEPYAPPWNSCRTLARFDTEEEARAFCRQWNAKHKPGRYSRKCEYSKVRP